MYEKFHDYKKLLDKEIESIKKSKKISKHNKELILKFHDYNFARDLSVARISRQTNILKIVAIALGKDFDKATKEDYMKFIAELKRRGLSQETVHTYIKVLKVFHKWLNGNNEYPECVAWMRVKENRIKKLPEELLTPEDVKLLLKFCENKRDKALVAVLWESGARAGEIGTMKIKHVAFDEFGCKITINGKTGMRRIRLVSAALYLLEWINHHPRREDPEAPLWVSTNVDKVSLMTYDALRLQLHKIARRVGLKKPVNPHNFRHSRATYLAQFLTEAQMKEYFGWVRDSDMAARYVHLSGKQMDDAILKLYGLKKEEKKEDILKPLKCPRCSHVNDVTFEYCEKCWLPLKPSAQYEVDEIKHLDEKSSIVLVQLLDMVKSLSKANPDRVQQILASMQQQLLLDGQNREL